MEEEEQDNGVIVQEMLVQAEKLVNQVTGETMMINLEDASQIVLQEPEGGATELQEAVQIQPGTYQILTGEEIQLGEEMAAQEVDGVTQIEVPLEMLQEAVEMLQGQDIQGDAVEAAIASIAARHLEIAQGGATETEEDMDIMEVTQSDIDAQAVYNPELLNSAEADKALPDTSELEALTAGDRDSMITVTDPETSKPSVVLVSESVAATSSKPRDMVSLLYGTTHPAVSKPHSVQSGLSSEAAPLQAERDIQIPNTVAEVSKPAATTTSETTLATTSQTAATTTSEIAPRTTSETAAMDVDTAPWQQPTSNPVTELREDSEEKDLSLPNKTSADPNAGNSDAMSVNSNGAPLVQEAPPPMEPPPPPLPDKKPDYSEPIEIKENMEISVGSRKCIILPNPDTGQLCAYPLIPIGGKVFILFFFF